MKTIARTTVVALALMILSFSESTYGAASDSGGEKQPVFLMCPYKTRYSSWSLYLMVDKANPAKVLSFGLEELTGKNAEDLKPEGYEKVLKAQSDPATASVPLQSQDAGSFGTELRIQKNDALRVSVTPVNSTTIRLAVSMRITSDSRFVIGGKEQGKRDVLLKYDAAARKWQACAETLSDSKGNSITGGTCRPISGIVFPVIGTGIYRIVGVMGDGNAVILLDK